VKNPARANEVVRTLVGRRVRAGALLIALNDEIADGRDVSWIWDVDFEPLIEPYRSSWRAARGRRSSRSLQVRRASTRRRSRSC
jgi:hypothetical protein